MRIRKKQRVKRKHILARIHRFSEIDPNAGGAHLANYHLGY